jgi:hypothetical protein
VPQGSPPPLGSGSLARRPCSHAPSPTSLPPLGSGILSCSSSLDSPGRRCFAGPWGRGCRGRPEQGPPAVGAEEKQGAGGAPPGPAARACHGCACAGGGMDAAARERGKGEQGRHAGEQGWVIRRSMGSSRPCSQWRGRGGRRNGGRAGEKNEREKGVRE